MEVSARAFRYFIIAKAICFQFLKEMEEIVEPTSPAQVRANSRIHSRAHSRAHSRTNTGSASFANFAAISERQPLLGRATAALENFEPEPLGRVDRSRPVAGGTVLGIHNLAIVFPQFIVCRFALFDALVLNGSHSTRVL